MPAFNLLRFSAIFLSITMRWISVVFSLVVMVPRLASHVLPRIDLALGHTLVLNLKNVKMLRWKCSLVLKVALWFGINQKTSNIFVIAVVHLTTSLVLVISLMMRVGVLKPRNPLFVTMNASNRRAISPFALQVNLPLVVLIAVT